MTDDDQTPKPRPSWSAFGKWMEHVSIGRMLGQSAIPHRHDADGPDGACGRCGHRPITCEHHGCSWIQHPGSAGPECARCGRPAP